MNWESVLWGKLTGYSRKALVETSFSKMKGLYGGIFYSKSRRILEVLDDESNAEKNRINEVLNRVEPLAKLNYSIRPLDSDLRSLS